MGHHLVQVLFTLTTLLNHVVSLLRLLEMVIRVGSVNGFDSNDVEAWRFPQMGDPQNYGFHCFTMLKYRKVV